MLDHLSIQCADVAASAAFYDAVLPTIGGQRILEYDGPTIGYGIPPMPDFWIGPNTAGNGFRESHIAFNAPDRAAVDRFFNSGINAGATCSTNRGSGRSITPITTEPSFVTPAGTTSKRCAISLRSNHLRYVHHRQPAAKTQPSTAVHFALVISPDDHSGTGVMQWVDPSIR